MNYPKLNLIKKSKKTDKDSVVDIDESRLLDVDPDLETNLFDDLHDGGTIAWRRDGSLKGKALFLNDYIYDWILVRDDRNALCLVPLRKE